MQAIVIDHPGVLALRDFSRPSVAGECLIRVRMAGICGTDLQLLEGYAGFRGIPGHEFVGTVEDVSSAADASWVGTRVAGEINVGCGSCAWCRRGEKEHCPERTVVGIRGRDGAFADYLSLPSTNLHAIPDSVDDEVAVFVEPVAAACRILQQIEIGEDTRVAVLGDGRLGLLIAQVLATRSPHVVVFGKHENKLALARGMGLEVKARTAADTQAFDVVVDATGRPAGLAEALDIVRPRGILVMKSTFHGDAPVATWPAVVHEVTLVGSRCGPFADAIALLATGAVQVKPLIGRVTALDDYESAFADARRGLKILLRPADRVR